MVPWRFFEYVTDGGANPFREWHEKQDADVRAALDFTVFQLRVIDDWVDPERKQFSELHGKHAGLSELRFWTSGGRKFRAAGLYRPNEREFVLLGGCEKRMRGSIYIPVGAFDIAMKHKQDFDSGKGTLHVHP